MKITVTRKSKGQVWIKTTMTMKMHEVSPWKYYEQIPSLVEAPLFKARQNHNALNDVDHSDLDRKSVFLSLDTQNERGIQGFPLSQVHSDLCRSFITGNKIVAVSRIETDPKMKNRVCVDITKP